MLTSIFSNGCGDLMLTASGAGCPGTATASEARISLDISTGALARLLDGSLAASS